ncbi:hypothetical protein MBM_04197 [Drepanopeziza brunnea f. sp. 'multigermtubi' MB_m1]|uniref:Uncharacterized protein n=1 Tax=Marssonina brunnea f. sp. multigermtubi (strain MB_m1) TaxID=1072389 RepID=K1XAS4_MARBU|nr:uncharacterized protein MBM_04197 [Drepanopeziza brunnea f. sp. 'multigermtubi' MB_m1]EKD17828.1 hypothetical protein MBM_04197 [Drepanopeziza brunnea f. sp. 'multigermtubi' MB_m1]
MAAMLQRTYEGVDHGDGSSLTASTTTSMEQVFAHLVSLARYPNKSQTRLHEGVRHKRGNCVTGRYGTWPGGQFTDEGGVAYNGSRDFIPLDLNMDYTFDSIAAGESIIISVPLRNNGAAPALIWRTCARSYCTQAATWSTRGRALLHRRFRRFRRDPQLYLPR